MKDVRSYVKKKQPRLFCSVGVFKTQQPVRSVSTMFRKYCWEQRNDYYIGPPSLTSGLHTIGNNGSNVKSSTPTRTVEARALFMLIFFKVDP